MSFGRAKRESIFTDKNKENLPGPHSYNPRYANHINGFKYYGDTSVSTIGSNSILERSHDDIDLHRLQSTPKVNSSVNSSRSRQSNASIINRSNLQEKRIQREHRTQAAQIKDLQVENEKIKAQLQKIRDLKDELEEDYVKAKEQSNVQEQKIERLQRDLQNAKQQIEELKSICQLNEENMKELKEQEDKYHRENVEQQSNNLNLLKRCESADLKHKELQKVVEEKSSALEKVQLQQFNDQENWKLKFEEKDQECKSQVQTLENNFDEERHRFVNEIKQQKVDMRELKLSLEARENELEEMQKEVTEKYMMTESYIGIAKETETERDQLAEKCDHLEKEVQQLTMDKAQLVIELNQAKELEEERVQLATRLEAQIAEKCGEIARRDDQKATADEAFRIQIEEMRGELDKDLEKLQLELEKLKLEKAQLEENLAKQTSQCSTLEGEKDHLEEKVQQSLKDLAEKNFEFEGKFRSQESAHQSAIEGLTAGKAKLLAEVDDSQKQFAILVQKNKTLSEQKETLRKGGLEYKKKRDILQQQFQELQQQFQELQAKSLSEDKLKQKDEEISRMLEELADVKRAAQSGQLKIREMADENRILKADATKNRINQAAHDQRLDELDSLSRKLSTAEASASEWEERFKELENFISPFRQDLAKYAEEKQHLSKENRRKNQELADLHNKIAGQMGHQNSKQKIHYLHKVKTENANLKEKVAALELELKKERASRAAVEEDLQATRGIRRFDPKKAFQH